MGGCCSVSGGSVIGDLGGGGEEWAQWDNHPARKVYEVLEDIGEGAFSKVLARELPASGAAPGEPHVLGNGMTLLEPTRGFLILSISVIFF